VILVVGRPGLDEQGGLAGTAGLIARTAAESGARVELVGSVGDDAEGDAVALALGRAGIGHAALLRDPAGTTPRRGGEGGRLPRLEAADLELGLSYLTECRVIVVAEPLEASAIAAAAEAASYHAAVLVVVTAPGSGAGTPGTGAGTPGTGADTRGTPAPEMPALPATATVLEPPLADDGPFAALVGRYAAQLDAGRQPADAWHEALTGTSWETIAE